MHGQHADPSSSQSPLQVPVSTFEPCEAELQYCIRLGDWWKAVQRRHEREQKTNGVVIVRIGEGDAGNRSINGRIHRLIKDASPSAPPDGYFDCTVEVSVSHYRSIDFNNFLQHMSIRFFMGSRTITRYIVSMSRITPGMRVSPPFKPPGARRVYRILCSSWRCGAAQLR